MLIGQGRCKFYPARFWKFTVSKESKKKILAHGIFLLHFIWIKCNPSFIFLWLKNNRIVGKGVLSRSEPLFFCPNPCFNSLGVAGRTNIITKKTISTNSISENLQVNFLEFLHCLDMVKIFTQFEYEPFKFEKMILKLDFEFFFFFLQFRKFIFKLIDLRSGIKFSGDFLIYKKKKTFNFHDHSKAIFFSENFNSKKINCIYCHNCDIHLLDIQNRTRLANQVSKFNIFSLKKTYYKLLTNKKVENFGLGEIILKRFRLI